MLQPLATMVRNTNEWVARTIDRPPTRPATRTGPAASSPVREADFLANLPIFRYLDQDELARLAAQIQLVSLPQGPVFGEDDPVDGLYVLQSGTAKVTKSVDGSGPEAVLALLGPGDSFGEIGLLDGLPRSAGITAMEPVRCYLLGRDAFTDVLDQHPKMARGMLQSLALMVRNTDAWLARSL